MTLSLQPQANFTIVRQIANHLDTDINYVRAVIRNAYTDEIIATLDLTDKGAQRFKKDWQVPADTSGQGFFVSVVTSVYTDNGYTAKNANYGDEETTYLVQDRLTRLGGGGGIDAWTVRRILKEELSQLPQPEPVKIPKPVKYDMRWDEVLEAIKGVKFEQKETDLAPVISRLNEAIKSVQDKEVTPEADLAPVLTALQDLKAQLIEAMDAKEDIISEKVAKAITPEIITALQGLVRETTFSMAPTTMKMNAPQPKQPEPMPFDPSQLAI